MQANLTKPTYRSTAELIPLRNKAAALKRKQDAWVEKKHGLNVEEIGVLAGQFSAGIPVDEDGRTPFSLAEVQGWLLNCKGDPRGKLKGLSLIWCIVNIRI